MFVVHVQFWTGACCRLVAGNDKNCSLNCAVKSFNTGQCTKVKHWALKLFACSKSQAVQLLIESVYSYTIIEFANVVALLVVT